MEETTTLEDVPVKLPNCSDSPAAPDEPRDSVISSDRLPRFLIGRIGAAASEPLARRGGLLAWLDGAMTRLSRATERVVPEALNPFVQLGAIANTTLAIALVSGVLLLFWYVPSVHRAHESVLAMESAPYLAGLLRTLHRYSSDACMLFILLHAFQTLTARKIGRARWIGWVSGVFVAGVIWVDGWTGYWLVWDEAARQVALGSARMLDALPLFRDPVSRSFLTDESVNSLLFFLVFFVHMLIPLAVGVALWVHVMRLNKSRFFTGRLMTGVILATLAVASVLVPVSAGAPAKMGVVPESVPLDPFYLLPLLLTDRLQGGALWAVFLLAGVLLFSLPWWLSRRRSTPAAVDDARCNGCSLCYEDCPYDAVSMRSPAGRRHSLAYVDPAKCVGCGICVGACDSNAIDVPLLPSNDVRRWLNGQLGRGGGHVEHIAFVCAHSAGSDLTIDPNGHSAEMAGYRIVPVPCSGWVHPLMIERALRRGATGVLIAGCRSDPHHRVGDRWTADRIGGRRQPKLRRDRIDTARVRHVQFGRGELAGLLRAAESFRTKGIGPRLHRSSAAAYRAGAVAVLASLLAAAVVLPNRASYSPPGGDTTELVVSFKHAGALVDTNAPSAAEQEKLLPHMRSPVSLSRERAPVRLAVLVDGNEVLQRVYRPGGLFNDGTSIAMERIEVEKGSREVEIRLDDTGNAGAWPHVSVQEVSFEPGSPRVVLFDRANGFTWK